MTVKKERMQVRSINLSC